MKGIFALSAAALLVGLGAPAFAAEGPTQGSKSGLPAAGSDDRGKAEEPAECPIKKTIDGKTFCFQNDPALTKPQGGH